MYNIIVFGASTTQGAFDPEGSGWVNRLAAYTFQKTIDSNFEDKSLVFNCGVSGDRITGLEKRYKTELTARMRKDEPTAVIFAIGLNDSQVEVATGANKTSLDAFKASLSRMIADVRAMGADYVACVGLGAVDESKVNPKPWDPAYAWQNHAIRQFDAAVEEVVKESSAHYIPMVDIFDGKPELVPDGIHPVAEGHRLMFERVKEHLEKAGII